MDLDYSTMNHNREYKPPTNPYFDETIPPKLATLQIYPLQIYFIHLRICRSHVFNVVQLVQFQIWNSVRSKTNEFQQLVVCQSHCSLGQILNDFHQFRGVILSVIHVTKSNLLAISKQGGSIARRKYSKVCPQYKPIARSLQTVSNETGHLPCKP